MENSLCAGFFNEVKLNLADLGSISHPPKGSQG